MSTIIVCPNCHEDSDGDRSSRCWRCGTFITGEHARNALRSAMGSLCERAKEADLNHDDLESLLAQEWARVSAS